MKTSHVMCLSKILTDLCFTKQKIKNGNYFCNSCPQCFSSKNVLTEHIKVCLSINGAQSVRFEKGMIKFKDYFKQVPVPFKTYADFECNLKSIESYEGSYRKKYQDHVPCNFAYKIICVDDKFIKPIVVFQAEIVAYEFVQEFLKLVSAIFSPNDSPSKTMKSVFYFI